MPKSSLDEIDLRILRSLQEDARLSNVELSEKVGLSASPCLRRVRRLEQEGVIAGYMVQDVCIEVHFGKHHPVDSSETAFKTAARMVFKQVFELPAICQRESC